MQKKVIALAVAGLVSGAAFAQSNVTVYGLMDAFAGVAKAGNASGDQSQTVVNQGGLSSSRLGFMGEEALGNGLKAIFRLELGTLDITGATNNIGNTRQAHVGFASDTLGKIYLGRIQTIGFDFAVKYDVLGASNAFSPAANFGSSNNILISSATPYGRQANAVQYISPKLGGVTLRADAALGEQVTGTSGATGTNKAQTFYSLSADYDNGPLSAGVAYAKLKDLNGTLNNVNGIDIADWAVAGKYDFKVAKPFLLYQESKNTYANSSTLTNKTWSAGLEVPVGASGAVKMAYVSYKNDAALQAKAQGWAIDYEQYLSKRTTAYIGYQGIHNGNNATIRVPSAGSVVASAGKNVSVFGLGVRHTF